ncbi:MAG TPA: low affinity iron permease family protein [Desertimonas sp.]|nr:low affinity iron permease family protein [Desertimonas sp.]
MNEPEPTMPSEVSGELGAFDRFATNASRFVSRANFFAACVLLVLIWAPSYFLIDDVDTWQLIINTATTIVTFLMVALLQNSQTRSDHAIQHKLNAIADGLADLMDHLAVENDDDQLRRDRMELHRAVGLESRETTSRRTRRGHPNDGSSAGDQSATTGA